MQAYSDALPIKKTGQISTIHTKSKETKHERERSHCHVIMILSYSELIGFATFAKRQLFSV